jgi:hypothetical protein
MDVSVVKVVNKSNLLKYFVILLVIIGVLSFVFFIGVFAQSGDPAGSPCSSSSDCLSGYCRSDYSGGSYCARDSTSCVHKIGLTVHQYSNGQLAPDCCSSQRKRVCKSGVWTCYNCGTYKKCENGRCVYVDSDGDGVFDYKDKCSNTPSGCTVANGKIDSSTGCPKTPFAFYIKNDVSQSCPRSSIPVDPYNAGCLSSSDASTHITLKIGDYIANNDCDPIAGTEGWHDIEDGRNYCEFKIDSSVPTGTYNLHAVYSLNGVSYDQTFKTGFKVEEQCSTSSPCSHGGRVTTEPTANLHFYPACVLKEGKYICKIGTKLSVEGISSYQAICSDGVQAGAGPVCVIAWLYSGSVFKAKADNKCMGCSSPDTPVPMKYRSDLLKETQGLIWNCDINWHPSGENKIDEVYIFSKPEDAGFYTLYLDYINAVCDSPDYICPTAGTLCKIGSMTSDYKGFENMGVYQIGVVDPVLSVLSKPEDPKEEFLDEVDKEVILTWKIKNTGVGDAKATVNPKCDPALNCQISGFSSGVIPQGDDVTIILKAYLPCKENDFNEIVGISVDYKDAYGLYKTPKKLEDTINLNVAVPHPDINFKNIGPFSHDDWQPNETLIQWNIINTGTGEVNILDVNYLCPEKFICSSPGFPSSIDNEGQATLIINVSKFMEPNLTVSEYKSVNVQEKKMNITYDINLKHVYDEAYSLECITPREKENLYPFSIIKTCDNESYYFEQIVNIEETNYTIGDESIQFANKTYYCVMNGSWELDPFSNETEDFHCYDVNFGDKNDNDIDCCQESNSVWLSDSILFEHGTHPYCCGDDSGEYHRLSNLDGTEACCNAENDCVYNNVCYPADNWYFFVNKNYYCAPLNGKWYEHPLAEFEIHDTVVIIGGEQLANIIVRNVQKNKDTVSLNLTGYKPARFTLNDKRNIEIELSPGEEKKITVTIPSSEPKNYELLLSAGSFVNPSLTDADKLNIITNYPASFSGMNRNSMLILVFISLLLYYKIQKGN